MSGVLLIFGGLSFLAGAGLGWFINEWVRAIDRETARLRRRPF